MVGQGILNFILMLIITLLFLTFLPVLLVIYFPFHIHRRIVSLCAQIFRKDLMKIVAARDSVLANDDFTNLPKSTMIFCITVAGDLTIEELREKTNDRIVKARDSTGNLEFPELSEIFTPWGGYLFRKKAKNFRIEEHVTLHNKSDSDFVYDDDLYQIRRDLLIAPYLPGRSPWEVVLVRNYLGSSDAPVEPGTQCVIIIKMHHGLEDGWSMVRLYIGSCREETRKLALEKITKPSFTPMNPVVKMMYYTKAFILAPYTLLGQAPVFEPGNIFDPTKVKLTGKRHPAWGRFPIESVKQTYRKTGTSFAAVVTAGVAGGIKAYLKMNHKIVPGTIDCAIPIPWPGHPSNKSRNYYTFATLRLPIDRTSEKCLFEIHKILTDLKRSVVPAVNFGMVPILGSLPRQILSPITKNAPGSILLSIFPSIQGLGEYYDRDIISTHFEGGYGQGAQGMGIGVFTYNGDANIVVNPEAAIIPTKLKSEELLNCIINELHFLAQDCIV